MYHVPVSEPSLGWSVEVDAHNDVTDAACGQTSEQTSFGEFVRFIEHDPPTIKLMGKKNALLILALNVISTRPNAGNPWLNPVAPLGPVAPVAPDAPVDPVAPLGPVEPVGPNGPVGPVAPEPPAIVFAI